MRTCTVVAVQRSADFLPGGLIRPTVAMIVRMQLTLLACINAAVGFPTRSNALACIYDERNGGDIAGRTASDMPVLDIADEHHGEKLLDSA